MNKSRAIYKLLWHHCYCFDHQCCISMLIHLVCGVICISTCLYTGCKIYFPKWEKKCILTFFPKVVNSGKVTCLSMSDGILPQWFYACKCRGWFISNFEEISNTETCVGKRKLCYRLGLTLLFIVFGVSCFSQWYSYEKIENEGRSMMGVIFA